MRDAVETSFPQKYHAILICARWMTGNGACAVVKDMVEAHVIKQMKKSKPPKSGKAERAILIRALISCGMHREARDIATTVVDE